MLEVDHVPGFTWELLQKLVWNAGLLITNELRKTLTLDGPLVYGYARHRASLGIGLVGVLVVQTTNSRDEKEEIESSVFPMRGLKMSRLNETATACPQ